MVLKIRFNLKKLLKAIKKIEKQNKKESLSRRQQLDENEGNK
jgi:hypothetical protein